MAKLLLSTIRRFSNVILIAVPGFHLLTILWLPNRKYWEPLGTNLGLDYALGLVILIANLLFLSAIWPSSIKIGYKPILMLVSIPFICISSHRSYAGRERILDTVEINHYRYHLTTNYNLGDSWDFYKLYRCYIVGGYCDEIESFHLEGAAHYDVVGLVIDHREGHIYVFKNGYLEFIYDTDYQNFDSVADITIGEYRYRLQANPKPAATEFVLSRCETTDQVNCQVLYTFASKTSFEKAKLVLDNEGQHLQIVIDGMVIEQVLLP